MGDDEHSSSVTRAASRQESGSAGQTSLAPGLEERMITVAQGIERQNKDLPAEWKVPAAVAQRLRQAGLGSHIQELTDNRLVYLAQPQGVRYTIRVVTRKDQFKEALETAGIHVIYGGHARYGRGPCFGDNPAPGDDWGAGTNPRINGIFPMAHPYLAIPVGEIPEHGYKARPVLATDDELPDADRDKYIKIARLRRAQGRRADHKLKPMKVGDLDSAVTRLLADVGSGDEVLGYRGYSHGNLVTHIVLHAGWQNTAQPLDLGMTELRCRVFCHFGCSSFDHNYPVVRFLKNWRREGNDRYAYWTTAPSNSGNRIPWLYHLLSYRKYNAFQSWHSHLRHALSNTNRELRDAGETYRLI